MFLSYQPRSMSVGIKRQALPKGCFQYPLVEMTPVILLFLGLNILKDTSVTAGSSKAHSPLQLHHLPTCPSSAFLPSTL